MQLVYNAFSRRYQLLLYLWRIEQALKSGKASKYYVHDCSSKYFKCCFAMSHTTLGRILFLWDCNVTKKFGIIFHNLNLVYLKWFVMTRIRMGYTQGNKNMHEVNNRNTIKKCETCSKLLITELTESMTLLLTLNIVYTFY